MQNLTWADWTGEDVNVVATSLRFPETFRYLYNLFTYLVAFFGKDLSLLLLLLRVNFKPLFLSV